VSFGTTSLIFQRSAGTTPAASPPRWSRFRWPPGPGVALIRAGD